MKNPLNKIITELSACEKQLDTLLAYEPHAERSKKGTAIGAAVGTAAGVGSLIAPYPMIPLAYKIANLTGPVGRQSLRSQRARITTIKRVAVGGGLVGGTLIGAAIDKAVHNKKLKEDAARHMGVIEEQLDTVLLDMGDAALGAGAVGAGGLAGLGGLYARGRKGLRKPMSWDPADIGKTIGRGASGIGSDVKAAGSSLWEQLLKSAGKSAVKAA